MDFNVLSMRKCDVLEERFHFKEIKEAIWMSDSDKNPGPDEFNIGFFKVS